VISLKIVIFIGAFFGKSRFRGDVFPAYPHFFIAIFDHRVQKKENNAKICIFLKTGITYNYRKKN